MANHDELLQQVVDGLALAALAAEATGREDLAHAVQALATAVQWLVTWTEARNRKPRR